MLPLAVFRTSAFSVALFLPLTLLAPYAGRLVARSGRRVAAAAGLHLSGVASALLFLVAGLSTVLMRSN